MFNQYKHVSKIYFFNSFRAAKSRVVSPSNPSNDLSGHLLHSHFTQTLQMRLH